MNAQEACKIKEANIKRLMKKIQTGLELHCDKFYDDNAKNWGYCGDLDHYAELLTQISDSLNHEGEYAS